MFSIPMLFFMGAANHFTGLHPSPGTSVAAYWVVALAILIAVEVHAHVGMRGLATQKYLTAPPPRGVIHAGFGLAVLLFLNASILL
jgi:succinate dehydrogenase hydrophobic anchor subunit